MCKDSKNSKVIKKFQKEVGATAITNRPLLLCMQSQKFPRLRAYLRWLMHPLPIVNTL